MPKDYYELPKAEQNIGAVNLVFGGGCVDDPAFNGGWGEVFESPDFKSLSKPIRDIFEYASELEEEGHSLDYDWADTEIRNNILGYVRVGLVAYRVKKYKLYKHAEQKFKTFQDYCQRGLGKTHWAINRMIEAARVCLELARAGFTFLPQNEAQARTLTKYSGAELTQKWGEVLETVPQHRVTTATIQQIVSPEPSGEKKQIRIDHDLNEELEKKAAESGMTSAELLRKLVQEYQPKDPETPEDLPETPEADTEQPQPNETVPISASELNAWLLDMKALLIEHHGIDFEVEEVVPIGRNSS